MQLEYEIASTWNGGVLHDLTKRARISLRADESGSCLLLEVNAFFYNDPAPPSVQAGQPCPALWEYEVVEAFFLGSSEQYLEIELCPYEVFANLFI